MKNSRRAAAGPPSPEVLFEQNETTTVGKRAGPLPLDAEGSTPFQLLNTITFRGMRSGEGSEAIRCCRGEARLPILPDVVNIIHSEIPPLL